MGEKLKKSKVIGESKLQPTYKKEYAIKKEDVLACGGITYSQVQNVRILLDRVTYIVRTIFNIFNQKFYVWEFHKEDKLFNLISSENIHLIIDECLSYSTRNVFFENGLIYDIGFRENFKFPGRWLYEDFEEELMKAKSRYEDLLMQQIKNKLNNEELSLLESKLKDI